MVNEEILSAVIDRLDLYKHIIKSSGLEDAGKTKISCDIFESITGAIYLDGGMEAAKQFILSSIDIDKILSNKEIRDFKSDLQIYAQKHHFELPCYIINKTDESFNCEVRINGKTLGYGTGRTKKDAEKKAAEAALTVIEGDL